eukprot:TRINITY_DN161_c0_g1_i2.p1 TRINITY_DN161_c0_g1~~TRINITY_DN161_c0_g1_i2.p1  ORF type:complete len:579 (-),score=196.19 TRINITY_DN161_c0_g1_i2:220-1779(-)
MTDDEQKTADNAEKPPSIENTNNQTDNQNTQNENSATVEDQKEPPIDNSKQTENNEQMDVDNNNNNIIESTDKKQTENSQNGAQKVEEQIKEKEVGEQKLDKTNEEEAKEDEQVVGKDGEGQEEEEEEEEKDLEQEQLSEVEIGLQLAWENLETARCIYEKYAGEKNKSELAEILLCLGDVSAEREDFQSAIVDYQKSLKFFNSIDQTNQTVTIQPPSEADTNQQQQQQQIPQNSTEQQQQIPQNGTDEKISEKQQQQQVLPENEVKQNVLEDGTKNEENQQLDGVKNDDQSINDKKEDVCLKDELVVQLDEFSLRVMRRRAETYFKLALVLQFSMRYKEAEENIEIALHILNKHHEACKKAMEGGENKDYIKKYLDDLPGTIDDLKNYQEELKTLQSGGGLAGLKAAIQQAELVALREKEKEQQQGEPSSSKSEEPKQVQDLGVYGRSKKKQNAAPLEENKGTQNNNNTNSENIDNNGANKRTREEGEKKTEVDGEDQSGAVKKLKIDETANMAVEQN